MGCLVGSHEKKHRKLAQKESYRKVCLKKGEEKRWGSARSVDRCFLANFFTQKKAKIKTGGGGLFVGGFDVVLYRYILNECSLVKKRINSPNQSASSLS